MDGRDRFAHGSNEPQVEVSRIGPSVSSRHSSRVGPMALVSAVGWAHHRCMNTRITVGYDTSPASAAAVGWAAAEAQRRGATLTIVSCYQLAAMRNMYPWMPTEAIDPLVEETESGVARMRDLVATANPGLEVATEVWAGRPSTILLKDAGDDQLIVVGTSRHHGSFPVWLGSTPRYLIRHSPCPVVVVRDRVRSDPSRVVVGVDGSAGAQRALQWAGEQADRCGVSVLVVHAWDYPYWPSDFGTVQAHDLMRIDAGCVLDKAVEWVRDSFAAGVSAKLVEDSPSSALLASIVSGDLVVLGSHGRGAVLAGLLGSTVNAMLERCVLPVVVVPGATPDPSAP